MLQQIIMAADQIPLLDYLFYGVLFKGEIAKDPVKFLSVNSLKYRQLFFFLSIQLFPKLKLLPSAPDLLTRCPDVLKTVASDIPTSIARTVLGAMRTRS